MFAMVLALGLALPVPAAAAPHAPRLVAQTTTRPFDLRATLMDAIHAMNAAKSGIFHDDVTAIVAPIFPPGQSFAETRRIVEEQHLGQLMMFKGTQMMPDGKMYVTKSGLMEGMVSEVDIVIDFDFVGHDETDMVLKTTKAFLRATSM